ITGLVLCQGSLSIPLSVKGKASMKRQKRNKDDRAYSRGYNAGLDGKSREECPFGTLSARTNWMGGWREGRTDFAQGMLGVSSIQNLKNIG
ncbi:ribosome modulation factor, partial [Alcanivorax sp. HI0007]|uniref:ribosome modulation factor n=2 Tax=Alcanivoracaceae TaxID=224372 RepID=UPI003513CB00